jgi:rSAM/selenodomain-associated transferase 1
MQDEGSILAGWRVSLFARPPRLGQVKTRLAAEVGEVRALALYSAFLSDALDVLRRSGLDFVLSWSESGAVDVREAGLARLLDGVPTRAQAPGDLGARMAATFAAEAEAGRVGAAIVGSDLPGLTPGALRACLEQAAAGARRVVLAPSGDGGYWCVAGASGLPWARIFAAVRWSSGTELAKTRSNAEALGLEVRLGPAGRDIDDAGDLRALLQGQAPCGPHTRALLARWREEGGR